MTGNYTIRPPADMAKGKEKSAFVRRMYSIFPIKSDSGGEKVRKIVFIIAVVAFIITGGMLVYDIYSQAVQKYVVDEKISNFRENAIQNASNGIINLAPEVVEDIKGEKPFIRDDFMELYNANKDLVGWINLGGEEKIIDNPVVQTDNNDFYLHHNFEGDDSKAGTIYVDYRSKFGEDGTPSDFLVMYGHNTQTSVAFSKLTRYYYEKDNPDPSADKLISFYQKHPTITFDTLKEKGTYKVFACGLFNTDQKYGEVYHYLRRGAEFADKDDFNSYILDVMDRSVLFTDVDLTYGDEIICRSPCYFPFDNAYEHFENVRCAVFARRVREGESPEVDVSKVTRNYYWVGWQQAVDRGICSPYAGRKWDTGKLLSYEEEP